MKTTPNTIEYPPRTIASHVARKSQPGTGGEGTKWTQHRTIKQFLHPNILAMGVAKALEPKYIYKMLK